MPWSITLKKQLKEGKQHFPDLKKNADCQNHVGWLCDTPREERGLQVTARSTTSVGIPEPSLEALESK